jgi:hypothetical protein
MRQDQSALRCEVASLRDRLASLEAVVSLQAVSRPKSATIDAAEAAAREAAKRNRIEEREAARQEHAAFVAKQALLQPGGGFGRAHRREWCVGCR